MVIELRVPKWLKIPACAVFTFMQRDKWVWTTQTKASRRSRWNTTQTLEYEVGHEKNNTISPAEPLGAVWSCLVVHRKSYLGKEHTLLFSIGPANGKIIQGLAQSDVGPWDLCCAKKGNSITLCGKTRFLLAPWLKQGCPTCHLWAACSLG